MVANIQSTTGITNDPCNDNGGYLLTSGDALRNLPNSVLKTSFEDYFTAHNCMFNSAMYYDKSLDEVFMTYKYDVFDLASATLSIGEVNNIEVAPLTQEMFAKLRIGYRMNSYDEVNGKDEFNKELQFQSGLTRVTSERNLVSPYRADMYGIELTRANLNEKTQADESTDNDIFWVHADLSTIAGQIPAGLPGAGEDYYDLYRDNTLTITGLYSANTAFNIDFSPKRRMFAHGYWIRSVLYPPIPNTLTYTTSSKTASGNVGMATDDGVTIITEQANESISSLPPTGEGTPRNQVLFPLVFTVEVKVPTNISILMANPHREIEFTYNGITGYGWLLQVSDEPSFTPKQTYKLIASTTNTLTDLINGI